jgi:DNA-binding PucR family transcriptional regulator
MGRAARSLGIHRNTLRNKISLLNIRTRRDS